jgi:hypothetical protein
VNQDANPEIWNLLLFSNLLALTHHFLPEGGFQDVQTVRSRDLTSSTDPIIAFFTFQVVLDEDVVVEVA